MGHARGNHVLRLGFVSILWHIAVLRIIRKHNPETVTACDRRGPAFVLAQLQTPYGWLSKLGSPFGSLL